MHTEASGKIGPNAIIQTGLALRDRVGSSLERGVFECAGLSGYLDHPPEHMVNQKEAAALFSAVQQCIARHEAEALLEDAGRRTGDYIIARRIPRFAVRLFKSLPDALAARLLLISIRRHAWTFAGSGTASIKVGATMVLEIAANPVATPGCRWHVAILRELFSRLIAPGFVVRHTACCANGDPACRFVIGPKPRTVSNRSLASPARWPGA